jgi:Flp pilus assembly protein TadG
MKTSLLTSRKPVDSHRRRGDRRGAATVECALCIPLIIAIMFGTLEICSALFLEEVLELTAYEGARVGVRRMATPEDAIDRVEEMLAKRNITGATITVTPNDFTGMKALDPIVVKVTAPTEGNSTYIFNFMVGAEVTGEVTMVREFDTPSDDEN